MTFRLPAFTFFRIASVFALTIAITAHAAGQAMVASSGDTVEVREGDVWSPAEYLGQEGRKHQVRYDDGTEEWVTTDRLRAPSSEPALGEGKRDRPQKRRFKKGQVLEFKVHRRWKQVTVQRVAPPLYLVSTNDSRGEKEFHWKWVDADRLRTPGEDHQGPSVFDQFEHRVNNDSIRDSQRKAKEKYAEHLKEQKQKAAGNAGPNAKADPFAAPQLDHPVTPADRSDLATEPAQSGEWNQSVIDPAQSTAARSASIRLSSGHGQVGERPATLSTRGRFALIALEYRPPGKPKSLYAEIVDLKSGRSRATFEFDPASLPLAVSPDGRRIAAISNGFHRGTKQRLDLWDVSRKTPQHLISFQPFNAEHSSQNDIKHAFFATPDIVVVLSAGGTLSAWDVSTGKGLWEVTGLSPHAPAALSPGGKFVAVWLKEHVLIIDGLTGQTRATLNAPGGAGTLTFSANGRWLVSAGDNRLRSWDLQERVALPELAGQRVNAVVPTDRGRLLLATRVLDPVTGRSAAFRGSAAERAQLQIADAGMRLGIVRQHHARGGEQPAFSLDLQQLAAAADDTPLTQPPLLAPGSQISPRFLQAQSLRPRTTRDSATLDRSARSAWLGRRAQSSRPTRRRHHHRV